MLVSDSAKGWRFDEGVEARETPVVIGDLFGGSASVVECIAASALLEGLGSVKEFKLLEREEYVVITIHNVQILFESLKINTQKTRQRRPKLAEYFPFSLRDPAPL